MLHVAKQILSGEPIESAELHASPLGRLSRSCSEAALRLLDVIVALRKKDMLSSFIFLDRRRIWTMFTNKKRSNIRVLRL